MNNVFCFDRSQLGMLKGKLSRRLSGSCLSIMRLLCLEANHSDGLVFGREVKRGRIFAGRDSICTGTGLSPRTVRSSLALLEKVGELTSQPTSEGTLYTVVNYDSYDGMTTQPTSQATSDRPASDQQVTTSKEEERRRKKKKTRQTCETTLAARKALAKWTAISALPESADKSRALEVLDELRRIDGLDWDRIERICEYAAREWVPKGYIGTPAALRQWTSSRDMRKWEAIERQLQAREAKSERPGDPADRPRRAAAWRPRQQKYVCCDPAGKPWTGRTRMRLMELYYPDATQDPDQGYEFTIPDDQMPANRRRSTS
jgi:hypothetical protein